MLQYCLGWPKQSFSPAAFVLLWLSEKNASSSLESVRALKGAQSIKKKFFLTHLRMSAKFHVTNWKSHREVSKKLFRALHTDVLMSLFLFTCLSHSRRAGRIVSVCHSTVERTVKLCSWLPVQWGRWCIIVACYRIGWSHSDSTDCPDQAGQYLEGVPLIHIHVLSVQVSHVRMQTLYLFLS